MKASAVAFSVKGAIGRYLHCCLKVLGNFAEGTLFCPEHYSYEPERYKLGKFSAYLSRWKPCLRLLNLSKVREGACVIVRSGLDAVCLFNGENSSWSGALFFKIQKSSISLVTTIHGVQATSRQKQNSGHRLVRHIIHSTLEVYIMLSSTIFSM